MKKIIVFLILLCVGSLGFSQSTCSTPANIQSVDMALLSPTAQAEIANAQKLQVQTQQVTNTLTTAGEWAGMGKEIGIAVKEGLSALGSEVDKVSKTDAGRFTMFVISWKVLGDDAKQIILGPILWLILTCIFFYLWRLIYKIRTYKIKDAVYDEATGKRVIQPAEYEIKDPIHDRDESPYFAGRFCMLAAYTIITAVIIFQILS